MLKREIHCVHDNGLPLLRHYGASLPRGRTCTFISDVQGPTNVMVDRSRNMHKRIAFLLFFSLSFFQIYLILRAKTSWVPVYYICNHGSEWKRCWNWFFFMGQLFFQCAIRKRISKIRLISFFFSHKFEELFPLKKLCLRNSWNSRQWIYLFKFLVTPYYSIYIKK